MLFLSLVSIHRRAAQHWRSALRAALFKQGHAGRRILNREGEVNRWRLVRRSKRRRKPKTAGERRVDGPGKLETAGDGGSERILSSVTLWVFKHG